MTHYLLPISVTLLQSFVPTRLMVVRDHYTGVVFTQKFPTTFVPKLVLLHGVTHMSTRATMQSGLAKLVSLKVLTSLNLHVYVRVQTVLQAFLYTVRSYVDSKHLLRLLPKNHTWLSVQS